MSAVAQGGPPIIALRSASFGYADDLVVQDVTFSQAAGEVVALLGPNGSGKSTLVKGILGLADHLGGEVELFGTPREKFHDHTRLGYVPQKHSLSTSVHATVREVVEIGRLPHRPWWRPAGTADARIVRESIAAVGLADRAQQEVAALSGGQQRRVLIARALASEPDVLVMDEPTAGVDAASQEVLAHVLGRLADAGTSMLVVTHELAALSPVVTRIVCLDGGRVDFDGTPQAYESHRGGHDPGTAHHHDPRDAPSRRGAGATVSTGPLDAPAREDRHG